MAIPAALMPVVDAVATLLQFAESRGAYQLREALTHPATNGSTEIDDQTAADATEPFHVLLDVIGEGAALTGAGYLKPADVEQIAGRTGVTEWWYGKANREDMTWPVAELRAVARALGLVTVRKGRIAPAKSIGRQVDDPQAILKHIGARLPIGKTAFERDAGWVALVVAAVETPAEDWDASVSKLLYDIGWRDGRNQDQPPVAESATLTTLKLLAGGIRRFGRPFGANAAVAALARSVIRA